MRKLVIPFDKGKKGFQIADPSQPVIIRDNRGIIFYSTEPYGGRIKTFNLPAFGTYWVERGSFRELPEPVKYNYADLPPLVRRVNPLTLKPLPRPFDFPVVFGINPNKCTVKWNEGIILMDSAFEQRPLNEVFFILYHEYAHAFFSSETLCDQMAGNYMKAKGFNPEQIGSAPITALSSKQSERKQNMVESIIQSA